MMEPCWCSSSLLMQRIIVDLPDPEGPQITIRSPRWTERLMFLSTWNSPYHLCISVILMAMSSLIADSFLSITCSDMFLGSL